jgi:acyl phosphate:glycerol-3-phosphate acyltransferase
MVALYSGVAVIAYLLGSIPFGYVLVKMFRGEDIRLSGSGNIGATNVARSGAKGLGVATLVLDAGKGLLAVYVAWWLARSSFNSCGIGQCVSPQHLMATAALAAVAGHVFPVWLKFRGGKGVATALGVFALLFPKAVLIGLVVFIVVVAISRYVSLGSVLGAIAFPIAAYFLKLTDGVTLALASAVAVLVVLKHHQNIRRLLSGTESRLGTKKDQTMEKEA